MHDLRPPCPFQPPLRTALQWLPWGLGLFPWEGAPQVKILKPKVGTVTGLGYKLLNGLLVRGCQLTLIWGGPLKRGVPQPPSHGEQPLGDSSLLPSGWHAGETLGVYDSTSGVTRPKHLETGRSPLNVPPSSPLPRRVEGGLAQPWVVSDALALLSPLLP